MIDKLLEENNLTHKELIAHWNAYQHLSHTSSLVKLKPIKDEIRNRIAKFYKGLRQRGYYPLKPEGEVMIFGKRDTGYIPYSQEVERLPKKDCKFGDCKNCRVMIYPEKTNCEVRTLEWMKGISNVLSVPHRPKGEGQKMAQDLIDYMTHDFMGGVASTPGPSLSRREKEEELPF